MAHFMFLGIDENNNVDEQTSLGNATRLDGVQGALAEHSELQIQGGDRELESTFGVGRDPEQGPPQVKFAIRHDGDQIGKFEGWLLRANGAGNLTITITEAEDWTN